MLDFFIMPFIDYLFMRRALVGCLTISMSAAPIGVMLMLRRMSLIGDAMSHAILPGAAAGFLLAGLSITAMTVGGFIAGLLVAILSGMTARSTSTSEDGSLAAFYLISLAVGVMIISMKGSSVDLLHILFGSILALDNEALMLLTVVAVITLVSLALIFRPLIIECFDSDYLQSVSRLSPVSHYCFLALTVLNLVGGFHAMGTLMSVGLMILPAMIARFWVSQLETMLALAVAISFVACVSGLLLSYHFGLPTSPLIIICLGVLYLLSIILGRARGLAISYLNHKRQQS